MPIDRVSQNFTEQPAVVTPYFKAIIENKVAGVALTCFETIVHWFLTTCSCFYPAYSRFYEQQKSIELDSGEVARNEAPRSRSQSSEDEEELPRPASRASSQQTIQRTANSSNSEDPQSSPSSNHTQPRRSVELTRSFQQELPATPEQQPPMTLQQIDEQISMATSVIEEVQRLEALEQVLTEPLPEPEPSPVAKPVTIVDAKDCGLGSDEVRKQITTISKQATADLINADCSDLVQNYFLDSSTVSDGASAAETILLAMQGQEVAGFLITAKTTKLEEFQWNSCPPDTDLVAQVAVDSKMQRSGIGTKLMLTAMAKTQRTGKRYLRVGYQSTREGDDTKTQFFTSIFTKFPINSNTSKEIVARRPYHTSYYDLQDVDFAAIVPGLMQEPVSHQEELGSLDAAATRLENLPPLDAPLSQKHQESPSLEEAPGTPKTVEQGLPEFLPIDPGPQSQADELRDDLQWRDLDVVVKSFYFHSDEGYPENLLGPVYQEVISKKLQYASTSELMHLLEKIVLCPWTSCEPGEKTTVAWIENLLKTELCKRLGGNDPFAEDSDSKEAAQRMLHEKLVADLQKMLFIEDPWPHPWLDITYKFKPYSFRSAAMLEMVYKQKENSLNLLMQMVRYITGVDADGTLLPNNPCPPLEAAVLNKIKTRVTQLNDGRDPYDDVNAMQAAKDKVEKEHNAQLDSYLATPLRL